MFCKKDCPPGHTRPGVMGTMEPRKREAPRSTLGEDLRLVLVHLAAQGVKESFHLYTPSKFD